MILIDGLKFELMDFEKIQLDLELINKNNLL